MAKTTINPLQLKITGSLAATIAEDGTFDGAHHFLTQKSGSLVKTVSADVMQAYFSKTDLTEAASQNEGMRLVFAARSGGDLDDEDLYVDTDVLTYNPSTTTFVVPHIEVGDDLAMKSDAAVLSFGADDDVTLTHSADAGLILNAGMKLFFRDAGDEAIYSVADGTLGLVAGSEIDLTATTIDINGAVDASSTITAAGRIIVDDATEATSTTDGSIQTDGGLSVAKSAMIFSRKRRASIEVCVAAANAASEALPPMLIKGSGWSVQAPLSI